VVREVREVREVPKEGLRSRTRWRTLTALVTGLPVSPIFLMVAAMKLKALNDGSLTDSSVSGCAERPYLSDWLLLEQQDLQP
jgi:hypothetical protein